ncbi:ATP-binding protein [Caulobacter sp.]|uniref:hybrid sensor histidine kinase/response regulator n=1 Tax=Caulobacter sp. TaxID=78 RepID=UPI001B2CF6A0|nr:ATP-binding protein [Caulobacter sp.]MBO9547297.1 response regulator [Caulobacter sp.]
MSKLVNRGDETERLLALRQLAILDTPREPRFDRIAQLAKAACNTQMAVVSLVDEHRQWFKAAEGLSDTETPREDAFCAHALGASDTLWVEDARQDPRFADNRLVVGDPFIRFYAGAPIRLSSGYIVGTVCVIDPAPRPYDAKIDQILTALAGLAADEMEAHASRATIDAFVDNAPISLLMTDLDLRIVRVSRTWSQLYGRPVEAVVGATLDEVFPGLAQGWASIFARVLAGASERGVNRSDLTSLGANRWFKWSAAPWRDAAGRIAGLLIASQDVTELEHARENAERASQAKSDFLANMSHEIRTPMNGVLGVVSALARTPLSPDQSAMVSLIERSGKALNTLLSDVLDVSRMEAGQLSLTPEPFDLALLVDDLADLFAPLAAEKALSLSMGPLSKPTWVLGDSVRLRQVLSNLVANGLKFTDHGGVEVEIAGPDADGRWRIVVRDTGIGFAADEGELLFDRFHQADASATRRFGGAGLGLSISRALARMMGGDLSAAGAPGRGASFFLDVVMPPTAPPAQAPDATDDAPVSMSILLAEDNPVNQQVVRLILDQIGADLTVVDDGQQALDAFRVGAFDLVLMDMQMPVMDGLTAVRAIRAFERESGRGRTAIKMLSANALDDHRRSALAAGADDHVAKPITAQALISAVISTFQDQSA